TKMETGRDLKRAVPSELVALSHPALAAKTQTRWARGELRLRGQKSRRKLGHGPVVLCEDGSGSMAGEKQMWAKAMTLAVAHFAKLQRRGFSWIHFGAEYSPTTVRVYPGGNLTARQLLEVADTFLNAGGTSFERPLQEAVKVIREQGLKKADILLVTDGMCAVSEKFLKELLAVKRALEVNIFTVLVNVGETADVTVQEFSDNIIPISALTADEAENKIFRYL
ncbi:MAG: VWA domain-containing protein, partial [candidate division WOR-3 bacterium]